MSEHVITHPWSQPIANMPGFAHYYTTVEGTRLHYVRGGNPQGEVLLLLAGFPQSWYAWHQVMTRLAARYHIIAPDLPGQGDSDKPQSGYDTQALAEKIAGLMQQLGIERHYLAAHDVGAWVAWPYAVRYSQQVLKLALLDAGIPGITLPESLAVTQDKAWKTWHFAFHLLPDLPEALISGREEIYLQWFLRRKTASPMAFSDDDMLEYVRLLKQNGALRAGLAPYREVELSAAQNRAQCKQGKLTLPVLAISADQGSIPDMATPLRQFADNVIGITIAHSGHFIPDEQPQALSEAMAEFFR
ncbi:alpha/beta fold hydrolase [Serratia odorifera]|jgi:pimeloyl-ACP methyl ester carboxylesterase|nr:alpha/beta hydrolase [Serratia odorifera]MBJ2065791.1 alpha/beta hydrolase [Serratia odorifera]PNK92477.1 alpha/beta hydrolase [Serratia odorifera]RII73573.1 alpha/beta hydrolase [Serratia odorifera]VDZ52066.1 Soluble epoxide hydrolase [Serratia odorifera]HEJ9095551.1 alpha/beta hydrolase [Serratia odorifera]